MGLGSWFSLSGSGNDQNASALARSIQLSMLRARTEALADGSARQLRCGPTVISGTMASARGLWTFDRKVVDGAVNGTGWLTIIGAWLSGLTDRTVVDGLVNLVGWIVQEGSLAFRRFQTGLVQNYALLMLFGIFAFVGIYLFVR